MNDQLAERLCVALEQLALELAERNSPAPAPYRAVAVPQPAQPGPFPPIGGGGPAAAWECPVHHSSRVQPAGAVLGSPQTSKAGKTYMAFLACGEYACNEKAPRGLPSGPAPVRAQAPSDTGQTPRSVLP